MKLHIGSVLCLLAVYVHECENLKILKKIHEFLHPSERTTTLAPVVSSYSSAEGNHGDDGGVGTTPWTEGGFSGTSGSFTKYLIPFNKNCNNENENQSTSPTLSSTSQPSQTVDDKYIDNSGPKESTSISTSTENIVLSNNFETPKSNINFNHQEENSGNNTLSNPGKHPHGPKIDPKYIQTFSHELTTTASVQTVYDYVTKTAQKQPNDIHKGDRVSSNNYNQQQQLNSKNQEELTNKKEPNSNTGYVPSAMLVENDQQPLESNKQQNQTNASNKTSLNQKEYHLPTQTQGETQFEEGGPIVFPTEAGSEEYVKPNRKDAKNDGNEGSFYAESTTLRTSNTSVPVPGDGGRVVINTPSKIVCPKGTQLDEGVCQEVSR